MWDTKEWPWFGMKLCRVLCTFLEVTIRILLKLYVNLFCVYLLSNMMHDGLINASQSMCLYSLTKCTINSMLHNVRGSKLNSTIYSNYTTELNILVTIQLLTLFLINERMIENTYIVDN